MGRVLCSFLTVLSLSAAAQSGDAEPLIFPPSEPQDHRTEALAVGVVRPADVPQAAMTYNDAEDWSALPPINFIPPPYHRDVLSGARICLDPGHGGDVERGGYKRGRTGFRESVMNLEVATMVRGFLEDSGAEVVMTREDDSEVPLTISDDGSGREEHPLETRARTADRENCDLFLSIHHNAVSRRTANYLSIWYQARPDHPRAAVDLARFIALELHGLMRHDEPQHMGLYSSWLMYPPDPEDPDEGHADLIRMDTTAKIPSGFGVLRHARVPAILTEGSFYTHPREELRLMDREYLRREAWGIYTGVLNYLWVGIPSMALHEEQPRVVEGPRPTIRLSLDDGMHEGWAKNAPPRIHFDTLRVYIDDERAVLSHLPETAEIRATPSHDLEPGEHTARLRVLNVWGNWSWPTEIPFTVE